MSRALHAAVLALASCAVLGAAPARAAEPLGLPRLQGPISLDGTPDEPAWQQVAALPLAVYEPVYGKAPAEATELRVAHDDHALYLAATLRDSRPEDVRDNSLYRDHYAGDDTVGLVVDAFNDDDTALWFYTTPAGTRVDGTVVADMASGQADWSWNGQWEAAGRRTADGWTAEMRIPFSTLGFQSEGGEVTMGLSVYRWLARHNERHIWPDVQPLWPRAYARPSRLQDVVLGGVNGRRAIYLTPYALGGYTRRPVLEGDPSAGLLQGPTGNVGLDAKFGLSSNVTLDVTANTDFAQVEADDEQINLTRFPLFFPEKRQFFLERASVFDFPLLGSGRLFNSRIIGLVDGRPIPIIGGLRLVGRAGPWDFGMLDMQTVRVDTLPTENFGVLRVRRQLGDPRSNVGAMVTSRLDGKGRYSLVYGLDSTLRLVGDEYLTLRWAQSLRNARQGEVLESQALAGSRMLVSWERRRLAGLRYRAAFNWSSEGFEPTLGFEPRRDIRALDGDVGHQWLLPEGAWLRGILLGVGAEGYQRNADGRVDTALARPYLVLESQGGSELELYGVHRHEDVAAAFPLGGGVEIPAGRHDFQRVGVAYGMASRYRLRTSVGVETGGLYDGQSTSLRLSPSWNASRHVNVGAEYELNLFRAPERGQSLDTHLFRLRLQLALDSHLSLSTLLQYSSVARRASVNARLRYHLREGNDVWLVYDERVLTGPTGEGLEQGLRASNRALLVKYTHTFGW
ncbi:MAG TPA: DUF5916 domain-containing protein [Archangium sp.]|nr:DUF5916 domain-containing protein [Archangium sp.]